MTRSERILKFTKEQRRWIRDAFYEMAEIYTVDIKKEAPPMYRSFVAFLSRTRRARWRTWKVGNFNGKAK